LEWYRAESIRSEPVLLKKGWTPTGERNDPQGISREHREGAGEKNLGGRMTMARKN